MSATRPKKQISKTYSRGFTLIELIIVTALIAIISVVGLARFTTFGQQSDIDTESQKIISTIQLARNQTLASEDESTYGVYFETGTYTIFRGADFTSATETREYDLGKAEIYEINLGGGSEVVFSRIRGTTTNVGNIRVRLVDEPSRTATILINSQGQVSIEESVSPTGTRIVDTRHLHLDFGWSMQSSNIMRLIFSDPPNPTVTEDIDISNFTSGGKFDWTGTVDVNGLEQVLHIHSHTLSGSNTVLSVHRDRRYNDKALEIQVDGTTIITFDAAGNATAGAISLLTVQ